MRRLLKLIALAGAGYGLWRLLTAGDPEPARTGPARETERPAGARAPEQPSAPRAPERPPAPAPGATKAELYERAKQLDIEGRSKMSKQQLERAIRGAG